MRAGIDTGLEPRKGQSAPLPSIVATWDREDHTCNWMYVWEATGAGQVVGKLGGYSGGGCWECYSFVAELTGNEVTHLILDDGTDRVTDAEDAVPPCSWESAAIVRCNDVFWEWNDEDEDDLSLSLKAAKLACVTQQGNQLIYENGDTDTVVLLSRYSPTSDVWNVDEDGNPGDPR